MKGSTSIKDIGSYLERFGFKNYQIIEDTPDEGKLLTGWDGKYVSAIEVNHKTNTVLFIVPKIATAKRDEIPPGRLADILTAIGFANYALMLGRFSYDPSDGELRYDYAVPIDNAELTYEQFDHLMRATVQSVNYWAPRLVSACEGARTGESIVESFLGHLKGFQS
ncbi:MAG TPA: YbjN domain-containing protein [Candidatus Limnocylindrales bacterium]